MNGWQGTTGLAAGCWVAGCSSPTNTKLTWRLTPKAANSSCRGCTSAAAEWDGGSFGSGLQCLRVAASGWKFTRSGGGATRLFLLLLRKGRSSASTFIAAALASAALDLSRAAVSRAAAASVSAFASRSGMIESYSSSAVGILEANDLSGGSKRVSLSAWPTIDLRSRIASTSVPHGCAWGMAWGQAAPPRPYLIFMIKSTCAQTILSLSSRSRSRGSQTALSCAATRRTRRVPLASRLILACGPPPAISLHLHPALN